MIAYCRCSLKYSYWDKCAEFGLILPTVDLFGAAMCLIDFVIEDNISVVLDECRKNNNMETMKRTIEFYLTRYLARLSDQYVQDEADEKLKNGNESKKLKNLNDCYQAEVNDCYQAEVNDCYQAEVEAVKKISTLIIYIYIADQQLFKFVQLPKNKILLLYLNDPYIDPISKYKVVKSEILDRFVVFRDLELRINSIRKDGEKTYN